MPHSTVSYSKYILTGCIMLIMCIFLIIIYVNHLKVQVENTLNYKKDTCEINSIEQVRVLFDCWDSGSVSIVEIPCLKIFVNTTSLSNVFFYRNIIEKMFSLSSNIECSYVPTACQNDPNYLDRTMRKALLELFPPFGLKFDCFLKNEINQSDAMLYLPDHSSYYLSIFVISIGFFLSFLLIFYGWVNIQIESKHKFRGFLSDLKQKSNEEEFLHHIKKILGEAHIDVDNMTGKIIVENKSEEEDEDQDDFDKRSMSHHSGLRVRSISVARNNSFASIQSFNPRGNESMKPLVSKLKLGNSEICVGRIEYRAPSIVRLSRQNSFRSYVSTKSNSSEENEKSINFYLGVQNSTESINVINREEELDIPDPIMEEDERYLTLQKKSSNKALPLSSVFVISSDDEEKN